MLGIRSLLGFGAGAIVPWAFGLVLDATNASMVTPNVWGWAFAVLGIGGLAAVVCASQLSAGPGSNSRRTSGPASPLS